MVGEVLKHVRELARVHPAQNDHLPALRVALSISVPLLVLIVIGRPDISIYAVFGGFTAMYGRADPYRLRLAHQGGAALLLTSGLTVGVWLSIVQIQPITLVVTESVFAVAASLAADTMRLRPSGPFYAIFALGACASVPTAIPWWLAVEICAGSAAWAMLIGAAGWIRYRTQVPVTEAPSPATGNPPLLGSGVHAARYLIAVAAAGALGVVVGVGHANWTMAAAAVPLAASSRQDRVHRGIHRVVGTFAGVLLTAAILLPNFGDTTMAVLIMILLFPTELFMTRHYGLALMFFTPVILLMSQLANPISRHTLVLDRGLDTLLGASVGIAVAILVREPSLAPRSRRGERVGPARL